MVKSAVPNKKICVLSDWNKEPHLFEKGKLTELQVKRKAGKVSQSIKATKALINSKLISKRPF